MTCSARAHTEIKTTINKVEKNSRLRDNFSDSETIFFITHLPEMFGRQRPYLFRRYGVCPATPLPYLPAPFRLLARLRPEALRPTLSGGLPFKQSMVIKSNVF